MNIGAVRLALQTGLQGVPELADLQIFRYPPGKLATKKEAIFFADAEVDQEHLSLAADLGFLTWNLKGGLFVEGSGAKDDHFDAAETRATDLLMEIAAFLVGNRKLGLSDISHCQLTRWTVTPTDAATIDIAFTLEVQEIV